MIIQTRDFGELEIVESEIIKISSPILGFDNETEYTLLVDDESDGMFSFLQSVRSPDVCFILTDPQLVTDNYSPKLTKQTLKQLGVSSANEIVYRVITVIPDNFLKATVNLKSPIVIALSTKRAAQIIVDEDYPLRAPLCETEA